MNDNQIFTIPVINEENPVNYIQWINQSGVTEKVLEYLFCDKSHEFSIDEKELHELHIKKIINNYDNINAYFSKVSERLWKKSS